MRGNNAISQKRDKGDPAVMTPTTCQPTPDHPLTCQARSAATAAAILECKRQQ